MKRKTLIFLLSAAVAASMLTACGGGSSAESAAPAAEEKTEAPAAEDKAEEKAEETQEAEETEAEEAEETEETEGATFSLLDVDESMVDVGVYGNDEEGAELVFTMFKGPDGKDYVSLFGFNNNAQSGDVICGTYEAETETDDEGLNWTYFDVEDVYTGDAYNLGIGENPDTQQVVFFDSDENVIEGKYLTPSETIAYMASAVNVLSSAEGSDSAEASDSEEVSDEDIKDALKAALTCGYAGASEENEEIYWATDDALTMGMFAVKDASGTVDGLVGAVTNNGDGSVTINDNQSGRSLTVTVESMTDDDGNDCFKLTSDNGTVAVVYEVSSSDVIDVMAEL